VIEQSQLNNQITLEMTKDELQIEKLQKENLFLKERLEFHELLLENSNSWESYRDSNGKIIYISSNFEQILGYDKNDFLSGKIRISDFVHPDDKEIAVINFQKQLDRQPISNFVCRVYHMDKTIKYISLTSKPVYNKQNEYLGFRSSIIDFTEQKQAEEALKISEEKYRLLFENMTNGFTLYEVITDENGLPLDLKIVETNKIAFADYNLQIGDLQNKLISEQISFLDKNIISVFGEVALSGNGKTYEYYAKQSMYFHRKKTL